MNFAVVAAKTAIEALYTDTCDIVEQKKNTKNGVVTFRTEKTAESLPCRLSVSAKTTTTNNDVSAGVSQKIELFLAPEITVPAGCRMLVHHMGRDIVYKASGVPAVYATHQEILLELAQERA